MVSLKNYTKVVKDCYQRVTVGVIASTFVVGFFAGSVPVALPSHMPFRRLEHSTSSNWSGYAAYGAPGSFSSVSATWVQPQITCAARQTSYSAFWVGLDGYNDGTVEQLGTEGDCNHGRAQYYAWFEMYPRPTYLITTALRPGDSISASVSYQGSGLFSLKLKDATNGVNFSDTLRSSTAQLSSAEAVAEAPWYNGVLPLANYGSVNFTSALANAQPLGAFSSLDPITMVDPYGMKSTPSAFNSTKENFSVTWSAS